MTNTAITGKATTAIATASDDANDDGARLLCTEPRPPPLCQCSGFVNKILPPRAVVRSFIYSYTFFSRAHPPPPPPSLHRIIYAILYFTPRPTPPTTNDVDDSRQNENINSKNVKKSKSNSNKRPSPTPCFAWNHYFGSSLLGHSPILPPPYIPPESFAI